MLLPEAAFTVPTAFAGAGCAAWALDGGAEYAAPQQKSTAKKYKRRGVHRLRRDLYVFSAINTITLCSDVPVMETCILRRTVGS